MNAPPTIEVDRLRVVRGGNVVLPDLSLKVMPGVDALVARFGR